MEYIKILADVHNKPTERQVYQLYGSWRAVTSITAVVFRKKVLQKLMRLLRS